MGIDTRVDKMLKSLELSTKHLIWLLNPIDDAFNLIKSLLIALTDQYQNMRQFISKKVSFPLSFLTYNWNNVLCNLPLVYFPNSFKYQSWMSVLSKLNSIEICEKGCYKKFITNHRGFSDSIIKLLGLLPIAVDVHCGTHCKIKQSNIDTKNKSSLSSKYFHLCV